MKYCRSVWHEWRIPTDNLQRIKSHITYLGFTFDTQKGSHEHWVLITDNRKYKVTVDCPKSPFSQDLIKSMAIQAGRTKKDFYAILKKL